MTFLHLNFSSTKTFLFSLLYRSSILSVKVSSAGLTLGKSQKEVYLQWWHRVEYTVYSAGRETGVQGSHRKIRVGKVQTPLLTASDSQQLTTFAGYREEVEIW